jgi:hypothetical protein
MALTSTKQQAYDHPVYLAVLPYSFATGTAPASTTITNKFVAFTSTIIKSVQLTQVFAETNTNTVSVYKVAVAGTTTSTVAQVIMGTNLAQTATIMGTAQGQTGNFSLGTTTLLQGDYIGFITGTDVSISVAVSIEAYLVPGANVTV